MTAVPKQTDAVSAAAVIAVGATGLPELTPNSPETLHALRVAHSEAVGYTFVLALAAACFAFPFSCAMKHLNIKHIAEARLKKTSRDEFGAPAKDSACKTIELDEEQAGGKGEVTHTS